MWPFSWVIQWGSLCHCIFLFLLRTTLLSVSVHSPSWIYSLSIEVYSRQPAITTSFAIVGLSTRRGQSGLWCKETHHYFPSFFSHWKYLTCHNSISNLPLAIHSSRWHDMICSCCDPQRSSWILLKLSHKAKFRVFTTWGRTDAYCFMCSLMVAECKSDNGTVLYLQESCMMPYTTVDA